ncbi:unnamed protein product [Phytophthora lilii]|uniref:Unnamed protein product n=1 Tax=Phytophthora lilii TaxID=2077276 RepID=A0A9W6U9F6_9STRA|nr:unnamed protein product [Phytophthora lilii]
MNAQAILAIAAIALIGSTGAETCTDTQQEAGFVALSGLLGQSYFQGCATDSGYSLMSSTSLPTDADSMSGVATLSEDEYALEDISWDEIDKLKYYVVGPTMFLAVRAAVYPSNLVKTRLQVQSKHKPLYSGTANAFATIFRQEGARGLYKGFGASTANVLTGNLYISVYEKSRKVFKDHTTVGDKGANFAGGAFASLVSQTVVVPLDIVSQRMMLSGQGQDVRKTRERAKGFLSVTKQVFRAEGFRGFYRGYVPSIATYAPSSSIWWGSYGLLVPVYYKLMKNWPTDPFWKQGACCDDCGGDGSNTLTVVVVLAVVAQGLSGASAGIITGVLTNPMDIVRTKAQVYTQYGAMDTLNMADDDADAARAQLRELQRQREARAALRAANCAEGVAAARAQLAQRKLKSDIKRSSAFVKKLRVLSDANAESLLRDAAELNLTRYVSECVAALADAPLKLADLAAAVRVASLLHQRYADFAPAMVRALVGGFEASYASDDRGKMLRRRLILRLLCELLLAGVFDDVQVVAHIIQRVARREQPGARRGKGNMSLGAAAGSQQLEVPLLVSFAKSVGVEFLGVRPKKYKDMEKLLQGDDEFQAFVAAEMHVVPEAVQQECLACYLEAYDMICKFYLAQHATFLKLDARNEKEEANRGEVTEEHVQELKNAKLLFEKLQTSVNSLADALDREVPPLPVEEKDDGSGRGGILVWEGGEGGGRELSRDGPFDDEATRSFYEDLPDLLELVPAVVLGLTEADVAELKKKKEAAANADEEAEAEMEEEAEGNADEDGKEAGEGDDGALEDMEADAAKDSTATDAEEEESKRKDETEDAGNSATSSAGTAANSYHHQLDAYFASLEDLVNRDRCDKAAVEFCYRNSKATRNRLVKTLYAVPRTHLELLSHYARLVATLQSVLKEDIGGELVSMLVGEFHGLIKRRNQFRLESKIKNIRFLAELVKFKICPPNTGFRCLQKCFQDFQGHNVHVATTFLENCGRFLYCSKHTHVRTVNCLNVMMKLKAAKHLDPQLETLVENAYYMCKPPERVERQVKQYDPMYLFLIKVLYQDLNGSNVNKVVKMLRRLPWQEPATCDMVLKALLKVTKGKVMQMKWICEVVKGLSRYHDEVLVLMVDDVLEYIRYGLEVNDYRDHQRSLGYVKLLGEIYNCGLVSMNVVVETLYLLINHSHDLLTLPEYSSDKISPAQLLEMKKRFLLVPDLRYDPRVPSEVDGPTEVFRVRLVSALIETCNGNGTTSMSGSNGSSNERGISRPRLGRFMTFFQRYLYSKTDVPMETDFVVFDLFEMLSSSLKDHFKKYETWEEVDLAVQEILRGDLEEAERRLSKKNAALLMATNGLQSVAEEASLSQPGEEEEEFLEDEEEDSDDDDDDDDEDEHDDEDQGDDDEEDDDDEDDDEDDEEEEDDDDEEDEEEHLIIHDRIQKSEEDEEFEKAFKSMMHGTTDTRKPAARVNVDKMAIPTVVKSSASLTPAGPRGVLSLDANGSPDGVVFRMLRRGNKGKVEARQLVVPEASSLAQHSHRQENAGKKEQSELKRLVLQNMERDDFMSDGPPMDTIPSFGPPPRANVNYGNQAVGQQANEARMGFGGGSEWNNAEFGLRRGKGYRGAK